MPNQPAPQLHPGDEAQAGTPGTGEDTCPMCHGTGHLPNNGEGEATPCPNCGGTGVIIEGIGGG